MKAKAFCPGHITGFFEICLYDDPIKSGSRGAGICISLGATAEVEISEGEIKAIVNGKRGNVTETAMKEMLKKEGAIANISLQLPISQGFGMSAAGTLATTLAIASLFSMPRQDAIKAAHIAEIKCSTGLGDVVTSAKGGIEIRVEEGMEGKIKNIEGEGELVLAVIGEKINTREILQNKEISQRIKRVGRECMKEILANSTLENFFMLSKKFAEETGLMKGKIKDAVETASKHGMASMCMLGNSVFAMGDTDELVKTLSKYGKVYTCEIDKKGARLI
ncbi:hypothetical protein B6U81_06905 [Thermoplasmatales archaeon ex4484_30]|nr:MAG: hypothetical protein B6U81_06905 [Thermoplasmatales archaeon ex4484_30]